MAVTPPLPLVIRPQTGWSGLFAGVAELWRYRELAGFLALRDLKVRYKQSLLGPCWALLQPLLTLAAFSGIFAALLGSARMPGADGVPYALSTLCALAPWQLFARGVTAGGDSLVVNQALVTKVYFPRLVVPLAAVLPALADFALSFLLVIALLAWFGVAPTLGALTLPLFLVQAFAAAFGVALWLSALNVLYRDVRVALPLLVQIGMLATPVVYAAPRALAGRPEWVAWLYFANPMAGVAEGFRHALLGSALPAPGLLALSSLSALLLLVTGALLFHRLEPHFADRV